MKEGERENGNGDRAQVKNRRGQELKSIGEKFVGIEWECADMQTAYGLGLTQKQTLHRYYTCIIYCGLKILSSHTSRWQLSHFFSLFRVFILLCSSARPIHLSLTLRRSLFIYTPSRSYACACTHARFDQSRHSKARWDKSTVLIMLAWM